MTERAFGLFIFGDEILSGKRQDRHFEKTREILGARGLALSWVNYLGDDRTRCVQALRESFRSGDVVFCCAGMAADVFETYAVSLIGCVLVAFLTVIGANGQPDPNALVYPFCIS